MPRGLRNVLLPRKKEDMPEEALAPLIEMNEVEDASTGPSEAVEFSFNSSVSGGKSNVLEEEKIVEPIGGEEIILRS